jgi:hypothetical protein
MTQPSRALPFAPGAPAAPAPGELTVFAIPPEIVPFSRHVEVRPVGPARPFAGGAAPELTAWIRFASDDQPPGLLRIITLMDALPPSYAAVMTEPGLVPTTELTIRPAAGLADASSPWVLVNARTCTASADGWIDERIHAWARTAATWPPLSNSG